MYKKNKRRYYLPWSIQFYIFGWFFLFSCNVVILPANLQQLKVVIKAGIWRNRSLRDIDRGLLEIPNIFFVSNKTTNRN